MAHSVEDKRSSRITHIRNHIDSEDVDRKVHFIVTNTGNPLACLMRLASNAEARAMYSWFHDKDLDATKQWLYVAGRLDKMRYERETDRLNAGGKTLQLFRPLLSDNEELIRWFIWDADIYDQKSVDDPDLIDFWAFQAVLALRGNWDRLKERCDIMLSRPSVPHNLKNYIDDYKFYLALANKDRAGIVDGISSLLTAEMLGARSKDESGFTEDLISKPAVIYAKIAWRYGFQIELGSEYVPSDWLAIKPLSQYDAHYKFLQR